MNENYLNIFTDGSSFSHPRSGGVGVRFIFPEYITKGVVKKDLNIQGYKNSTNNQMELTACILALKECLKMEEIQKTQGILIHTDSMYVIENYKRAIYQWRNNKWRNKDGMPIMNTELWKELLKNVHKIYNKFHIMVEFEWVKGHSKNEDNEAVDKLAKKSAKNATRPPSVFVSVRRKRSSKKIERGSVKIYGQKITIRIITSKYLKEQNTWMYKYEVVSKNNKFYNCVDIIFCDVSLRVGHTYVVRFNNECKYPQITKIFSDLTKKERENKK